MKILTNGLVIPVQLNVQPVPHPTTAQLVKIINTVIMVIVLIFVKLTIIFAPQTTPVSPVTQNALVVPMKLATVLAV